MNAPSKLLLGLLLAGSAIIAARGWSAHEAATIVARLERFDPGELSEHGRRAYEELLVAEAIWTHFSFWQGPIEITHRLFDLWDEPESSSTPAFLSLCEHGTQAARFYGLAGLSQSDPWTFRRALPRYGRGEGEFVMGWDCIPDVGIEREKIHEYIVDPGDVARSWRGVWSRTVRAEDGPEPWRTTRP